MKNLKIKKPLVYIGTTLFFICILIIGFLFYTRSSVENDALVTNTMSPKNSNYEVSIKSNIDTIQSKKDDVFLTFIVMFAFQYLQGSIRNLLLLLLAIQQW